MEDDENSKKNYESMVEMSETHRQTIFTYYKRRIEDVLENNTENNKNKNEIISSLNSTFESEWDEYKNGNFVVDSKSGSTFLQLAEKRGVSPRILIDFLKETSNEYEKIIKKLKKKTQKILEEQKKMEEQQNKEKDEQKQIEKTKKEQEEKIKGDQTTYKSFLRPKHKEMMDLQFDSIGLIGKVSTNYISELDGINKKFSSVPQDEEIKGMLSEIDDIKEKAEKIKEINSTLEVKTKEYLLEMYNSYLIKFKEGNPLSWNPNREFLVTQLTRFSANGPEYISWMEKYLTENTDGDDPELVKAQKQKVSTTAPKLVDPAKKVPVENPAVAATKCPCSSIQGGGKNKRKKNTKNKRKKNTKNKRKKYTKRSKKKSTKRKNVRNR